MEWTPAVLRLASRGSVSVAALAACGALSCARLLGIDGDYVARGSGDGSTAGTDGAGGSVDAGGLASAGASGGSGSGGDAAGPGASGAGGGGGSSGGSGGVLVEAGTPADAASAGGTGGIQAGSGDSGAGCRPGRYSGDFTGSHTPAVPIVIGQIDIATFEVRGSIWMVLRGSGSTLQFDASDSAVDARLYLPGGPAATGQFSGSVAGTFDCRTHELVGSVSGQLGGSGFTAVNYTGTLAGDESGGSWSEHETLLRQSTGSGSWSISCQGP